MKPYIEGVGAGWFLIQLCHKDGKAEDLQRYYEEPPPYLVLPVRVEGQCWTVEEAVGLDTECSVTKKYFKRSGWTDDGSVLVYEEVDR